MKNKKILFHIIFIILLILYESDAYWNQDNQMLAVYDPWYKTLRKFTISYYYFPCTSFIFWFFIQIILKMRKF